MSTHVSRGRPSVAALDLLRPWRGTAAGSRVAIGLAVGWMLGLNIAGCESVADIIVPQTGGSSDGGDSEGSAGCPLMSSPIVDPILDTFEDGMPRLALVDGRSGYWWNVHDDTGTQMTEFSTFADDAPLSLPGSYSTRTRLSGLSLWGGGIGVKFVESEALCPYDASSFGGIEVWARGTGTWSIQVLTWVSAEQTALFLFDVPLTSDWRLVQVPWSAFQNTSDETLSPLAPEGLVLVQFLTTQAIPDMTFELVLDDLRFMDLPSSTS